MANTEYLHPSVATRIIDNSQVFQTAQGTTKLFVAFRSPLGVDNQIVEYGSEAEFLFKTGVPNLSKYGQAAYNAAQWLRGGGGVYGLRILPDDATFANVMAKLIVTVTPEVVADPDAQPPVVGVPRSVKVKPVFAPLVASITSKAAVQTVLNQDKTTTNEDGSTTYELPLFVALPPGRGDGYNGMGMQISLRSDLDSTYDSRTYNFSITAKDATGADVVVAGPFLVSLDPDAKDKSRASMFLPTVVNKYASDYFQILGRRDNFDKIAAMILGDLASTTNPAFIDILFGQERSVYSTPAPAPIHGGATWDATGTDLNSVIHLASGSEGTWTGGNAEEALYVKAYSGLIDNNLLDPKIYEVDVILDANYDAAVKNAISDLIVDTRQDCIGLLDVGFQGNEQQSIDFRRSSISMSNFYTGIYAQHGDIYDAYNGETVTVTSLYLLASMIPANDAAFGIQWPFVGPRRGVISGFDNINFIPNEMWKENLYKAQVNYIERDPRKTNFATQLTTQTVASALSDINNVRALLRIKRETETMLSDYRMEFNDKNTYDSINYNLNNNLQKWVSNRALTYITATVYASDYDRQQKIARVRIELEFTGIIERIYTDIVVNR
jgi:hypothetical protein